MARWNLGTQPPPQAQKSHFRTFPNSADCTHIDALEILQVSPRPSQLIPNDGRINATNVANTMSSQDYNESRDEVNSNSPSISDEEDEYSSSSSVSEQSSVDEGEPSSSLVVRLDVPPGLRNVVTTILATPSQTMAPGVRFPSKYVPYFALNNAPITLAQLNR